VANAWPASSNATGSTTPAANPAWQDYFADPTLRQLINTALANNRDLRVATLAIEQARAQLGIRRADQFPTLNAAASSTRTPNSAGVLKNVYSAGLTVTAYELDFFGRVASLKEQALAQYLASAEAAQTTQISLIATVAQGWLALLADEALLSVSRQTLDSRAESLKLTELKLKHGAASELDLRLAQTLLETARVTLAQQQRQRALDENALVLLLGKPLSETAQAQLSHPSLDQLTFSDLPAGLPSDLLSRRPDIRQAEQNLIASNANIGAARAAFFPRISLTASLGSASGDLSGLFKNGSWGWIPTPQLVLPIFDGGRNQSNLDASKVGRDMAVAQYEKSIQSAFREVADALATRLTLGQQLQATQALLAAESERTRLTKLRFDNGAANQLDWLDAQRSLFAAQQSAVQIRLAVSQSQIALFKVLGGSVATNSPPRAVK
jgi:multidrug efflux system outer membrane protein